MKQVPLYEAKNGLSALVQQVEETGDEFIITRHGKPSARLSPVRPTAKERARALARLAVLQEEEARRNPPAEPLPWEILKRWMRDEPPE